MKIGYDGTLRPSSNPGVVSAGGTQVNSRIVRDIANATPETQKLVNSIFEVGQAIAKTGEKIRDADFAIDSQKLRLQYAGAMEGVRQELATKNFKDFNEYQAAFTEKEEQARNAVLESATGENGYFRNYNSVWHKRVGQDLDFLRGNAELNAMKTWNQLQIKRHYDEIDQQYKDAFSLGIKRGGLEILKSVVPVDNRMSDEQKQMFIARNTALMSISDYRNDANNYLQNVYNEDVREQMMVSLANDSNGEETVKTWYENATSGIDATMDAYRKQATELKKSFENLPENERKVLEKQVDDEITKLNKDFRETGKLQLRQRYDSMQNESRQLDAQEVKKYKDGLIPSVTRINAQKYVEVTEKIEAAKEAAKAAKGSKKEDVKEAFAGLIETGKLTTPLQDPENVKVFNNLINARNALSDNKIAVGLDEVEGKITYITLGDTTFNASNYESYAAFVDDVQKAFYSMLMWDAAGIDFSKQSKRNELENCANMYQLADMFLTSEQAKNVRNVIDAKFLGINADRIPKETLNSYASSLKNSTAEAFGCKNWNEFQEKYGDVAANVAGVASRIGDCVSNEQAQQIINLYNATLPRLANETTRNYTVKKLSDGLTGLMLSGNWESYVKHLDKSVARDGLAPEAERGKEEEALAAAQVAYINSHGSQLENRVIYSMKKRRGAISNLTPHHVAVDNMKMLSTPEGEAEMRLNFRWYVQTFGQEQAFSYTGPRWHDDMFKAMIWGANGIKMPFAWFHRNAVAPVGNAIDRGVSSAWHEVSGRVSKSWAKIKASYEEKGDKKGN